MPPFIGLSKYSLMSTLSKAATDGPGYSKLRACSLILSKRIPIRSHLSCVRFTEGGGGGAGGGNGAIIEIADWNVGGLCTGS